MTGDGQLPTTSRRKTELSGRIIHDSRRSRLESKVGAVKLSDERLLAAFNAPRTVTSSAYCCEFTADYSAELCRRRPAYSHSIAGRELATFPGLSGPEVLLSCEASFERLFCSGNILVRFRATRFSRAKRYSEFQCQSMAADTRSRLMWLD
jgi:hypothetical protein